MARILLSGGTGFLGRNIVPQLMRNGHDVLIVSTGLGAKNRPVNYDTNLELIEISQQETHIHEFQPEIFLNLQVAFHFSHDARSMGEMMMANVLQPLETLSYAIDAGLRRLISPTSFAVFADGTTNYSPQNFFAGTKEAFSRAAIALCNLSEIKFDEIVVYDTFGENDDRTKITKIICEALQESDKVDFSPGNQILDLSHIEHLADGLVKFIQKPQITEDGYDLWFASSGNRLSVRELANKLEDISGNQLIANWGGRPHRKNEIFNPIKAPASKNILENDDLNSRLLTYYKSINFNG